MPDPKNGSTRTKFRPSDQIEISLDLRGSRNLFALHAFGGADRPGPLCSLIEALGDAEQLRYAREHRDVVQRFGRFPHRNPALGRETTPAEQTFLELDGFWARFLA
jgi:hypothetical protein